jgi:CBS domain-containing protein
MSKELPDAKTELRIALAGPAVSLGLALFFSLATHLVTGFPAAVFHRLAVANGALGLFNLVPGLPLDGGRVLRSLLWRAKRNLVWATHIASRAGKAVAVAMIVVGFFGILLNNPVGIWTVLIGLFLLLAADAEYRHVRLRSVLGGISVERIMRRDVVTVRPEVKIGTVVDDYFFKYHYKSFPVADENTLLGVITLGNVKDVSRHEWHNVTVGEAMIPPKGTLTVAPNADAADVFQKMLKAGIGTFYVVEAGRLVGVLTRRDIVQLLRMKTDLGK